MCSRSTAWSKSRPKGTAPSNLSITGRYILQPEIFKILETLAERGAGGEIQLTDAMIGLAKTQSFYGVEFEGERPRLRLQGRFPARQHRVRPGARRSARRPARGDEDISGPPVNDYDALRDYLKKQTQPEFVLRFDATARVALARIPAIAAA